MSIDYLSKLNSHPRDKYIDFEESTHTYTVKGDTDFISVTTWNHKHFKPFDSDDIINKMMNSKKWSQNKYYGMTKEEIKKLWSDNGKKASEAGTKMHYDIECFYNGMEVINDSIEYNYFKRFYEMHKHLKPYRTEWTVYDEDLRMSGSIDMVFENEDGMLSIYDWKRCKDIKKTNTWADATTECINHLPDSNYWHYALQLNTYKAILEKNYGKKVKDMYLICLHPNNKNKTYMKIKVCELKEEIENLFKLRLSQL